MNLWWMFTSSSQCSYEELKKRQCLALGWPELDDLSKYVRDKPNWERQFKTFVQLKGNVAYNQDKSWDQKKQCLKEGVPAIFWRWLNIRKGDLIAVMETGSQMTFGQIEVRGIAQATQDGMASYNFDDSFHHAHQISSGLNWVDWDIAHHGELPKPEKSFNVLTIDNTHRNAVYEALQA